MPKKPTGARPVPKVTGTSTHKTPKMNATKPAVKHTNMPAPKRAATNHDTSRY